MSSFKRRKCKKSICFDAIPNKEKPTPNYTAASSSNIKILENVQICPPLQDSDSDSDYEIFDVPKKKKMNLSTLEHTSLSNENIHISPCIGKQFSVLQNVQKTIFSTNSNNNNTNTTPTTPTGLMTPTRRFQCTVSRNHGLSSPTSCSETSKTSSKLSSVSLNALCTSSRCSSLNNISCSTLLPLELNENSMQKLIKATVNERITINNINNSPFTFKYTFEDEKTTDDEKPARQTSECTNNSQENLKEINIVKQQENNNIIKEDIDQNKQNRSQEIQDEQKEELKQDVENKEIQVKAQDQVLQQKRREKKEEEERQYAENQEMQEGDPETNAANDTETEQIGSNASDDLSENLSSDIISEDEDTLENISESESGQLEGEKDWIDIPDHDVLNFDESTLESVINIPIRNKLPAEIYSLFVSDDIVDKIAEETNKYAKKCLLETEMTAKSRSKAWKPTDANEMRQFFSVILTMGLNKVPHFHDYWSKNAFTEMNTYALSWEETDLFCL